MPELPPRITEIVANRFRGATSETRITFDASKAFVLVFGENGTGKSTIVDAVEFVSSLTPGSISDISGASEKQHLQSIGSKLNDLSAELTVGEATWRAAYSGRQIQRTPTDPCPSIHVLRRGKILSLVNAPPAKRFEQLKRFIDVTAVEKCETELLKALNDAKKECRHWKEQADAAESRIAAAFAQERSPEEAEMSPEEWAAARSRIDFSEAESRKALLKKALDNHAQIEILHAKKNAEQERLNGAREVLKETKAQVAAFPGLDAKSAVLLIDLLGKAREYLSTKGEVDACPVCGESNGAAALDSQIDTSLKELSPLVELATKLEEDRASVRAAEVVVGSAYKDLVSRSLALAQVLGGLPEMTQGSNLGPDDFPNVFAYEGTLTRENIAETCRFVAECAPALAKIRSEHDSLEKKIAPSRGIKRDYQALVEARAEAARTERVREVLEIMYGVVARERKAFVQRILDSIADRCDALYARIHPGEKLGNVRFALDQEKRASLDLAGSFEGYADVPPQAYFSESHLDTLGFCFFLALTHFLTEGRAIIVLDDVFTSVDARHIDRCLDMLLEESGRYFQVILLTHQRRWLDRLESDGVPRQKADVVTLKPWSLERGVQAERQ
jgi:energy-coupling factor transporter ATP-binding protein EcfA2